MNKTTKEYHHNLVIMTKMDKLKDEEKAIRNKYEKLMQEELDKLEPKRRNIQSKCKHDFRIYSMDGEYRFRRCIKCDQNQI